jgi:type VI secretion system secreted protein VgrG
MFFFCFRYNDHDRHFLLVSIFLVMRGGGGGNGNKVKSLTALSGSIVSLEGDAINIIDAKGNKVIIDGTGNITIQGTGIIKLKATGNIELNSDADIKLNSGGKSFINLKKDGVVEVIGTKSVFILGQDESVKVHSNKLAEVRGIEGTKVESLTKLELGAPATDIKGEMTLTLASAVTQIAGTTTTEIKGGTLLLNC